MLRPPEACSKQQRTGSAEPGCPKGNEMTGNLGNAGLSPTHSELYQRMRRRDRQPDIRLNKDEISTMWQVFTHSNMVLTL